MTRDYREYPRLYDLQCEQLVGDSDLQYWSKQIERCRPTRILELGCGTGRIIQQLLRDRARLGMSYTVTGVDSSETMLELARAKLASEFVNLEMCSLVHGDFKTVDLNGTFDFILCGINTLMEFHDRKDQRRVFERIHDLLSADGVFLFDVQVFPLTFLHDASQPQEHLFHRFTALDADEIWSTVSLMTSEKYDQRTQTLSMKSFFFLSDAQGAAKNFVFIDKQHVYNIIELELLCELNALNIVDRWSSYEFDSTKTGWHLLWALERQ